MLVLAIGAGAAAAWFLFQTLVVGPSDIFLLIPPGIAIASSFVLTWIAPDRWQWLAFCVALPTLLMSLLFGAAGMVDGHWLALAGIAMVVCAAPAWLAHRMRA